MPLNPFLFLWNNGSTSKHNSVNYVYHRKFGSLDHHLSPWIIKVNPHKRQCCIISKTKPRLNNLRTQIIEYIYTRWDGLTVMKCISHISHNQDILKCNFLFKWRRSRSKENLKTQNKNRRYKKQMKGRIWTQGQDGKCTMRPMQVWNPNPWR